MDSSPVYISFRLWIFLNIKRLISSLFTAMSTQVMSPKGGKHDRSAANEDEEPAWCCCMRSWCSSKKDKSQSFDDLNADGESEQPKPAEGQPSQPNRPKVVSTADAKGASTDNVKQDLKRIAGLLLEKTEDQREERCEILAKEKQNIHEETRRFLDVTKLREEQHRDLMKEILPHIPEINYLNSDRKPHDWSKDDLFFFVAPAYFDGGVQTPEMKAFVDSELKRHYVMESHHPEHEMYHDVECSFEDIVEMSIDRLARNVQFGDGRVNLEVMEKFKPKFTKGDNEAKQKIFWDHVVKYSQVVEDKFLEIYPDAKEWASTPAKE